MAKTSAHDPILTTFFLCDQVIRDDIAKKWGAIGLFNTLFAQGFPITFDRMAFFARIADAPDVVAFSVAVYSPNGILLAEQKREFDRSERPEGALLSTWWEVGGYVHTPTFSAPGVYRVVCSVGGRELGELSLHLKPVPIQP